MKGGRERWHSTCQSLGCKQMAWRSRERKRERKKGRESGWSHRMDWCWRREEGRGENSRQMTVQLKRALQGGERQKKREREREQNREREEGRGRTRREDTWGLCGTDYWKHVDKTHYAIVSRDFHTIYSQAIAQTHMYTRICDGSAKVFTAALFVFSSICVPGGDISAKCLNQWHTLGVLRARPVSF